MFKALVNSIFSKKAASANGDVPVFKITETPVPNSGFEVSELSFDEYEKFVCEERRKTPRILNN